MIARRLFLKQTSAVCATMLIDPSSLLSINEKKAGIQLYTLRDIIWKNTRDVLNKVAQIGFKEVETYGYDRGKQFGMPLKEFSALLKELNLVSPSGHYGIKKFLFEDNNYDELKELIEAAKTLGQQYIVIPYIEESRRKILDDYKAMALRLNKAAELCKDAGLTLAYHNHDFEFKDYNGVCGYDIFLKETDSNLLKMEMDLFWVHVAGKNPIELFKTNPGRFIMWHVKDSDKVNPAKNTEIGNGSIDFVSIAQQAKLAGVKHYYLEQENFSIDAFESLTKSILYMQQKMLN